MRNIIAIFGAIAIAFNGCAEAAEKYEANRISVQVIGQGPDVILIPGLASAREVWTETAAALKDTHRVHLVQLKGFAGEPAAFDPSQGVFAPAIDALAAYIEASRVERPAIIGHSFGGAAALALAARHPKRVGRTMVVDALPFYPLLFGPQMTSETARPFADRTRDGLLAMTREQFAASQGPSMARLIKGDVGRTLAKDWALATDRAVMAHAIHDLMTTDLRAELPNIGASVTVLYAYDPVMSVPPEAVEALWRDAYASASATELVRVEDSLHFVMWDQPERFQSEVAAFLAD